jgi:tol-pal system protein YbgF
MGSVAVFGQSLERKFLLGFGAGSQKLVTNVPAGSQFGIGGEGVVGYRFTDRFGATGSIGYETFPVTGLASSNFIYGNVLLDAELLNQGTFHPYLALGGGGVNYPIGGKRVNDVTAVGGVGFRFLLSEKLALNLNGLYNRFVSGTVKNGYASARLGLTFMFGGGSGSSDQEMFAEEDMSAEEMPTDENGGSLEERVNEMETSNSKGSAGNMQDYVRLKSQVDEINQDIDNKEREISSLMSAVNDGKRQVGDMQMAAPAVSAEANAGFSRVYEQALSNFYAKRYPQAIQMFSDLINQFPTHSLISSCHYWSGEAQFNLGNYQEAITELSQVLQSTRSLKKDDALLVLGKSYSQLNRKEEAREALNRLIREFPNSEFVPKAEAMLNQM